MSSLPVRQEQVLWLRYGLDGCTYTQEEVAHLLGLSRNTIYATEQCALQNLRTSRLSLGQRSTRSLALKGNKNACHRTEAGIQKIEQQRQEREGRLWTAYRQLQAQDIPVTRDALCRAAHTLTYNYLRDYGFKCEQHVSILTLEGRVSIPYTGYDKHVTLIQQSAGIGGAKLWYDKPKKQFYLIVSLEVETPDPTPETHKSVVGVDVGVRYLAVTSTTKGECNFYSSKHIVPNANHYARLRKRLQHKGTRSATRRLMAISGRERRLKQDANHVVSKRITTQYPHVIIGLEDLTHIRERTNRRRKGKKASKKQRRANAAYSKWSFAELQSMIAYKALLNKSIAVKVDAYYTSKACPICGHISDTNRPNKGLLFVCQRCQYTLHADLVGSRNITLRTLLIRQDWMSTGILSVCPDMSDDEAKAARLSRYAELRWSSDISSTSLDLR